MARILEEEERRGWPGGTKFQCSSNKFDGPIQVIHISALLESALKAGSQVVERRRPVRVARGAK
jgi:hypothetical protein